MKIINTKFAFPFAFGLIILAAVAGAVPQSLPTVAESSQYKATSLYADVMGFIRQLQLQSSLLRVEELCLSPEGKSVPLLVIGNPPPASALELKNDGRAAIYIQANIHAGEVEGKEASLMLARDILLDEELPYLEDLVILIAPIFNADGNEQISPTNRRSQVGPEQGVGVRYNGQNLDLNRDSIKLESPELHGLVRNVLLRWDPVLLVDCHTTNGSYHKEPVTYSWPLNPNGSRSILAYMRDVMMPAIQNDLRDTYQTLAIPYGNFTNFSDPSMGWRTFSHQPRYVTNYIGLRNRLSILDENYSYADFKTRVLGNYNLLRAILDYCSANKSEIQELVREADRKTVERGANPTQDDVFAVETEVKALEKPVVIQSWEMKVTPREGGRPRVQRTEKEKTYTVPYFADFAPKRTISIPFGYLLPGASPEIKKKLLQHGLVVEVLTEPLTIETEAFQIKEIKGAERLYQGHRTNSVTGEYIKKERAFPTGTLFIGMAQPLGNLAAYLLEPESDDGLLIWNFFDRSLVAQWGRSPQTYPVFRVLKPVNLVKNTVK